MTNVLSPVSESVIVRPGLTVDGVKWIATLCAPCFAAEPVLDDAELDGTVLGNAELDDTVLGNAELGDTGVAA